MKAAAGLVSVLVVGCLLSIPTHVKADGDAAEHTHGPRHGGYFGDADDLYHYEVLLDERHQFVLYVNDYLNRPLDVRRLKGQWRLSPDEPGAPSGAFRPSDDGDHLIASLPPDEADPLHPPTRQGGGIHVEVAVLKGRQWVRMEFYLPALPDVPPLAGQAGAPTSTD